MHSARFNWLAAPSCPSLRPLLPAAELPALLLVLRPSCPPAAGSARGIPSKPKSCPGSCALRGNNRLAGWPAHLAGRGQRVVLLLRQLLALLLRLQQGAKLSEQLVSRGAGWRGGRGRAALRSPMGQERPAGWEGGGQAGGRVGAQRLPQSPADTSQTQQRSTAWHSTARRSAHLGRGHAVGAQAGLVHGGVEQHVAVVAEDRGLGAWREQWRGAVQRLGRGQRRTSSSGARQ